MLNFSFEGYLDNWLIYNQKGLWAYYSSPTDHHLGLDKKSFNVVWIGWSGMKWAMLEDVIETMVDKKGCPSVLLIHCGGMENMEEN